MSSPFHFFRENRRVAMVIVTGLSMISFVLLGTLSNPREMPQVLVVLAFAAIAGGAFWMVGLLSGKSTEYGSVGLVLGALVGFVLGNSGTRTDHVLVASTGNLSANDMSFLHRQRNVANQFMTRMIEKTAPPLPATFAQFEKTQPGFAQYYRNQFLQQSIQQHGFGFDLRNPDQEMVLGELLYREAKRMGLTVSDAAMMNYLKEIASDGNPQKTRLTRQIFEETQKELNASQIEILNALKHEWAAKRAMLLLFSQENFPPEVFYEFYRKLHVKQEAEVVAVPVKDFLDEKLVPTDADLKALFQQYHETFPNVTVENRYEEGRPGFRQPRRIKLAYLEAAFEDFKGEIPEVPVEEVEAYYEQHYKKAKTPPPSGPMKPDAPPAGEKADAAKSEPAPAEPDKKDAKPEEKAPDKKPPEEKPKEEKKSSQRSVSGKEFVALLDEKPADAPKPEPAKTPAEKPATEAAKDSDKPAEGDKDTEKPAADAVEPPLPGDRPLDDALKVEIALKIQAGKVYERMGVVLDQASEWVADRVGSRIHAGDEAKPLTPEEARNLVNDYAKTKKLKYVETEFYSPGEFQESADVTIGRAVDPKNFQSVMQSAFRSQATATWLPNKAEGTESVSEHSMFSWWKLAERPEHIPERFDETRALRESVVKEWQRSQARPKAQSRAKGLVEIALKSPEKLLEESLAQETLSGEKDGLNVTSADLFHKTGEFSWLQGSVVPHTGMDRQTPPPTRFTIPGLTDAGDEFMQTVFDELKPGGVGVASNIERTVYYVVRITKRDPSDAAALEKFRKDFLETGTSAQRRPEYGHLYRGKLQEYLSGWQEQLMKKHGATLRQHDANAKRAAEPVYDEGEY